jgi:hypothetical protein
MSGNLEPVDESHRQAYSLGANSDCKVLRSICRAKLFSELLAVSNQLFSAFQDELKLCPLFVVSSEREE